MTIHAQPRADGSPTLPLCLNDLVFVESERRIPDLTLADRLGFSKPHNVRKLIQRNRDEMAMHGILVEREASFLRHGENPAAKAKGGRPGVMYLLNEGQALVVCALSRTPIAARVRQDIIAVYMAHRKREYCPAPTRREREALHFLANHSCVIQTGTPVHFDNAEGFIGFNRNVLLAHVTEGILDTLAEFENEDVIVTDNELELGIDDELHDGENDDEPILGWAENVGQLRLEGSDDGDNSAPERAGAGFVRCSFDDAEPSLGAVNPIPGIIGFQILTARGPEFIRGGDGIDQTFWGRSGTDDREVCPDVEEGDTLDEHGEAVNEDGGDEGF